MNENDKILINAYLDGETSEADSKYVESLIESSNQANEYANKIKRANNEINAFFNSSDVKYVESHTDQFIELKTKEKNISFFKIKFNYIYSSVFALSLLGIFIYPSFYKNNEFATYTVPKTRSVLSEIDNTKIVERALYKMIEENQTKAKIISDDYEQFIIMESENSTDCYLVTIKANKTEDKSLFCPKKTPALTKVEN